MGAPQWGPLRDNWEAPWGPLGVLLGASSSGFLGPSRDREVYLPSSAEGPRKPAEARRGFRQRKPEERIAEDGGSKTCVPRIRQHVWIQGFWSQPGGPVTSRPRRPPRDPEDPDGLETPRSPKPNGVRDSLGIRPGPQKPIRSVRATPDSSDWRDLRAALGPPDFGRTPPTSRVFGISAELHHRRFGPRSPHVPLPRRSPQGPGLGSPMAPVAALRPPPRGSRLGRPRARPRRRR